MDAEQRRVENRHQLRDLRVRLPHHRNHQRQPGDQVTERQQEQEAAGEEQREQQRTPCHEAHRFIAVRNRPVAADIAPQRQHQRKIQSSGGNARKEPAPGFRPESPPAHHPAAGFEESSDPNQDECRGERQRPIEPVIEFFGTETQPGRHMRPALLLLVVADLAQHPCDPRPIPFYDQFADVVHGPADKERLPVRQLPRQVVDLRRPAQQAVRRVGIGKNPQHTARADHPDDVEFLIGLARRTPGSPFEPVFVDPVAEIRQPRITPADLQQAACPGTPDADHRFAFPVVVIEQPAGKHLLGRKSPVAALPAEFHRKILSQSLQRTDTVVVVDIQVAQFRGDLARKRLRQGVSRPGTLYGRRTEDKAQRRLAERRAAQQPPETPAPVAQERQHGNEQQPVPGIGDADAPRIIRNGKGRTPSVLVIGGLVEPIIPENQDAVHADFTVQRPVVGRQGEKADEIHRRTGAGIILDAEIVQPGPEGQYLLRTVTAGECGRPGIARAQVQRPLPAEEPCHGSPREDDREREVQQQDGGPPPQFPAEQAGQRREGEGTPKRGEPARAVDMRSGEIRTVYLFKYRGRNEHRHHGSEQPEGKAFQQFQQFHPFVRV